MFLNIIIGKEIENNCEKGLEMGFDKMEAAREKEFLKVWEQVKNIIPRNKKILITGSNGLIASNLVDTFMYFNEQFKTSNIIAAMCRNQEKGAQRFKAYMSRPTEFQLLAQDVCNFSVKERYDYVIHAASNAHPLAFATKAVEKMNTNLMGTLKVLEYAETYKVKKMVYVSTSEIYGEADGYIDRFSETEYGSINTLNPRSCYSESKRCAETMCVCYGKEREIDISIVRPGYIYGAQITEDNSRADAQFLRNILKHENIVMKSAGEQRRSYCYVMDAVCAILFVLLRGGRNEAYNIANMDSAATIIEFAEALSEAWNVKVIFDLPSDIEKSGYSIIKNSLLNDEKVKQLGWRPNYNLEEGACQAVLNLQSR